MIKRRFHWLRLGLVCLCIAGCNAVSSAPTSTSVHLDTSVTTVTTMDSTLPSNVTTTSSSTTLVSHATETISGVVYTFIQESQTYHVTGYSGSNPLGTILSSVNDKPVDEIAEAAFRFNTVLTQVVIPFGIVKIGSAAFYGCSQLQTVSIPDSVVEIGSIAFLDTPWFDAYPDGFVYAGKVLYFYKGYDGGPETMNNIRLGTVSISPSACERCYAVKHLVIPEGVQVIGAGAFMSMPELQSVTLPDSLVRIDEFAFSGSYRLSSVAFGNGLRSIGDRAFQDCHELTQINLPFSLRSIGEYAFAQCYLISSLTIPSEVTQIGEGAFLKWNSLTEVTISPSNPAYRVLDGVLFSSTLAELILYPRFKSDTQYAIPQGVEHIGIGAFFGNSFLQSVTMPHTVLTIASEAFANMSIESIVLSESLQTIVTETFSGSSSLSSIAIPDSVHAIEMRAFYGCNGLTHVFIGSGLTLIDPDAFESSVNLEAFEVAPENLVFRSVSGVLFSKDMEILIFYPMAKPEEIYVIPSGVKTIGDHAFAGIRRLQHAILGADVEIIGYQAFLNGFSLEEVTFNLKLTTIEKEAFRGCANLQSIALPDSLRTIGEGAFRGCSRLISVLLGNGVETIGWAAFLGCYALDEIFIPANVTVIENYVFEGCPFLTIRVRVAFKPVEWMDKWDHHNHAENLRCTVIWNDSGS